MKEKSTLRLPPASPPPAVALLRRAGARGMLRVDREPCERLTAPSRTEGGNRGASLLTPLFSTPRSNTATESGRAGIELRRRFNQEILDVWLNTRAFFREDWTLLTWTKCRTIWVCQERKSGCRDDQLRRLMVCMADNRPIYGPKAATADWTIWMLF
jgi:hypothetical protein